MATKWNVVEQGNKRRRSNGNQNRKSTDTRANSGKAVATAAAKAGAQAAKKAAAAIPAKKQTTYYTKKKPGGVIGTGRAVARKVPFSSSKAPTIRNIVNPAARAPYYRGGPDMRKRWGIDFGNDVAREQRASRLENETPESKITDESPYMRMKRDLAPGSEYRMRNWINSRVKDYPEDRGTTLAQAARLASLYQAVDPITKGYTREQAGDMHRQIQDAPVNLQELFIKYGGRLQPMLDAWPEDAPDSAHFNQMTGRVYGVPGDIAKDSSSNQPYWTLWHEYGHNLDWLAGDNGYKYYPAYTESQDIGLRDGEPLRDLVPEDVDRSLRDYWARVKLNETPFDPEKALKEFGYDLRHTFPSTTKYARGLSDMMGQYGLKHGGDTTPILSGHDADYWNGSGNQSPEAFADMVADSISGGPSLRYTQAVLPNTYDAYLAMLTRMVNGG